MKIVINKDTREEKVPEVDYAFPYRSELCDLSAEPDSRAPWHWHREVELFYVCAGSLEYSVPGKKCVFNKGDVGFINSNVLHMTTALTEKCIQQEHIFLPGMIGGVSGSIIDTKYVQQLVDNSSVDIICIKADSVVAQEMRQLMDSAYAADRKKGYGNEILIRNRISECWIPLIGFAADYSLNTETADNLRLKSMLRFIDAHFAEPITLSDIAASAHIGPREASRCFKRQLQVTALDYLLSLRIDRACEMLKNSSDPIGEVAVNCGFCSASYFSKLFNEWMHMTPTEYRNSNCVYRNY